MLTKTHKEKCKMLFVEKCSHQSQTFAIGRDSISQRITEFAEKQYVNKQTWTIWTRLKSQSTSEMQQKQRLRSNDPQEN